jgi:hypothetical protein
MVEDLGNDLGIAQFSSTSTGTFNYFPHETCCKDMFDTIRLNATHLQFDGVWLNWYTTDPLGSRLVAN